MVQVEIEYQNHIPTSHLPLLCSINHVFNGACAERGQAIWGLGGFLCTLQQEAGPGEFKRSLYKCIPHPSPQGWYSQARTSTQPWSLTFRVVKPFHPLVQTGDTTSHIPTGILYPSYTLKPTSNWAHYESLLLKVPVAHTNAQFNPFFQAGKIWPNFSTPSFEKLSDHGGYWYLGC